MDDLSFAGEYGELTSVLAGLKGKCPVYIPNPGNAGDSLIAHATYQLLDRVVGRYELGNSRQTYPGRIVIFGGGGNLVPEYQDAARVLAAHHRSGESFVLLPHSIRGHEGLLSELGSNCHIFCREKLSYDHVRAQATKAHVYLAPDMALQTNLEKTKTDAVRLHRTVSYLRCYLKRRAKLYLVGKRHQWLNTNGVLNAFRVDREATGGPVPSDNFDVSMVYYTRDLSPPSALDTVDMMIGFLSGFTLVRTDRLHQAILSAMIGKKVEFYPNSYWKNQAVYEYSLKHRFPNIDWRGG